MKIDAEERNIIRLDEVPCGGIFYFEGNDILYIATDEFPHNTERSVVDLKDGILFNESVDARVIVRDDLILTNKEK